MKAIQVRLPDYIHEKARDFAHEEGISINSFIVSSVFNEVVQQETRDFSKKASSNSDPQLLAEALSAIPDAQVPDSDKL